MPLDIDKYRHHVAGLHLSKQEEAELIQAVWGLLEGFVDQAFGRHPYQQCGRVQEFNDLQEEGESLESKASSPLPQTQPISYHDLKHVGPP